jgi:hypothetical protein
MILWEIPPLATETPLDQANHCFWILCPSKAFFSTPEQLKDVFGSLTWINQSSISLEIRRKQ